MFGSGIKAAIIATFRVLFFSLISSPLKADSSYFEYRGICDASAAVALNADSFIVANDEDNVLRVYRRGQPSPMQNIDLSDFLNAERETDIEASAAIGNRIYWITSHGRNRKGKDRPERQRLFATDIVSRGGELTVIPVGTAYTDLLADLVNAPHLSRYRLGEASALPPKTPGALNIEGLAATPDGKLLIGFRNPIPNGKALIIPLENPSAVISGSKAMLGQPIELALGGLGIRSFERVGDGYLIIAGPYDSPGAFTLYKWSNVLGSPPVPVKGINFYGMHPEALFAVPDSDTIQILSDNGKTEDVDCKDMPESQRFFRSITVKP
jgi:hypothetical protein